MEDLLFYENASVGLFEKNENTIGLKNVSVIAVMLSGCINDF